MANIIPMKPFQGLSFTPLEEQLQSSIGDLTPQLNLTPIDITAPINTGLPYKSLIGQGVGIAGNTLGSLIGGELQSGAGNVINTVGGTVGGMLSTVNPLLGGIVSGASGLIGGAVNGLFGEKEDKELHAKINANTEYLKNFTSNASSFDNIQGPMAVNMNTNVYKGGLFSSGAAERKNRALSDALKSAFRKAQGEVAANVDRLQNAQNTNFYATFGALGGPLHTHGSDWNNNVTLIDNGGTHEQNPLGGIPMGTAPDGEPNLVEEGEVIYNDYVFSNRIKVPKAVRNKYKLRGTKDMTFALAAKKVQKESEERPNDPISKRGLKDIMGKLMMEQEMIRQRKQSRRYAKGGRLFAIGGPYDDIAWSMELPNVEVTAPGRRYNRPYMAAPYTGEADVDYPFIPIQNISGLSDESFALNEALNGEIPDLTSSLNLNPVKVKKMRQAKSRNTSLGFKGRSGNFDSSILRYAPTVVNGLETLTDTLGLTNKADYSNIAPITATARAEAADIKDARVSPVYQNMVYKPMDNLFYANELGAQATAARRNIINTAGGNRGAAIAGLLSSNLNSQTALGKLYREGEESNWGRYKDALAFNMDRDKFNASQALNVAKANQEAAYHRANLITNAAIRESEARESERLRAWRQRRENRNSFLGDLSDIGREGIMASWINKNPGLRYKISRNSDGVTYGTYGKGGLITKRRKNRR